MFFLAKNANIFKGNKASGETDLGKRYGQTVLWLENDLTSSTSHKALKFCVYNDLIIETSSV